MSRYTGQHFAPTEAAPTMSAYKPAAVQGRSKGMIAVGVATLILAAVLGFFVGRQTAPDDSPSTATSATATEADSLVTQGIALHQAGKLDEASALYQQALKADSKNKFALFNIGQIAQTRQQYDSAIASYKAAIAVDKNFSAALYNLGLAYTSTGDRANAITTLRTALVLTPQSAPTLFNLGTLLVQEGKTEEGTAFISQAITIDPTLKPKS